MVIPALNSEKKNENRNVFNSKEFAFGFKKTFLLIVMSFFFFN